MLLRLCRSARHRRALRRRRRRSSGRCNLLLVCHVMADCTASSRTDQSMMASDVAANAAHGGTFEAALGDRNSRNKCQTRSGGTNSERELHGYLLRRNVETPGEINHDQTAGCRDSSRARVGVSRIAADRSPGADYLGCASSSASPDQWTQNGSVVSPACWVALPTNREEAREYIPIALGALRAGQPACSLRRRRWGKRTAELYRLPSSNPGRDLLGVYGYRRRPWRQLRTHGLRRRVVLGQQQRWSTRGHYDRSLCGGQRALRIRPGPLGPQSSVRADQSRAVTHLRH